MHYLFLSKTISKMAAPMAIAKTTVGATVAPAPVAPLALEMADLTAMVRKCDYITKCTSNKKKDPSSLSYLVDTKLSQSDCIKLGIGIEKYLIDIIQAYTTLDNIKEKNKKGKKETDHLFMDPTTKTIYYAELKANLNLDTEKSKSTYNKCLDIVSLLKETYPGYTIQWCLLGIRYTSRDTIPKIIRGRYSPIDANLYGINDYFTALNIPFQFTEESYRQLVNVIATAMFSEDP